MWLLFLLSYAVRCEELRHYRQHGRPWRHRAVWCHDFDVEHVVFESRPPPDRQLVKQLAGVDERIDDQEGTKFIQIFGVTGLKAQSLRYLVSLVVLKRIDRLACGRFAGEDRSASVMLVVRFVRAPPCDAQQSSARRVLPAWLECRVRDDDLGLADADKRGLAEPIRTTGADLLLRPADLEQWQWASM